MKPGLEYPEKLKHIQVSGAWLSILLFGLERDHHFVHHFDNLFKADLLSLDRKRNEVEVGAVKVLHRTDGAQGSGPGS